MTDRDDPGAEPPKKAGFFRRLFGGGGAAPVELPADDTDDALPATRVPARPEIEADPAPPPALPQVQGEAVPSQPVTEPPVAEPPTAERPATEPPVVEPLGAEPLLSEHVAAAPPTAEPLAPVPPDEPGVDVASLLAPTAPEPDPTPQAMSGLDTFFAMEAPGEAPEPEEQPRGGWWSRLKKGLARSSSSIGQGITDIFTKRRLDATTLEDLDDILIRADLGVATASRITDAIGKDRFNKQIDPDEVRAVLAREVEAVLAPLARPLPVDATQRPFTIMLVGVNGSGKTTTIGKLAAKFAASRRSVMLAAGDTFRAAAVEQLRVWGARTGAPVITREQGADAAGLAFDAYKQAQEAGTDILLIDTAGRLQNRTELMDELAKITRVLRKLDGGAPHAVLLVLDATVGQNAMSQVDIFGKVAGVTGLIMTKLDGTARGGILVAIADKFNLPIHFIGVGEGVDDLEPFTARDFARAIAGLDEA